MVDLYIDGEWNGYGGQLISMALVCADGRHFYEVLPCAEPVEWVRDHVMPVLEKCPIQIEEFRARLTKFLSQFDSIHIISDWPEDIVYFCGVIVTGAGERIDTPPMTMEVFRIDTVSTVPHNAFWDAMAFMEHMESQKNAHGKIPMSKQLEIDSVEITTGRGWELLQHKNAHGKIPMSKQLDFAKIVHFQVNDGGDVIILLDNGKVYEKIYCGNGVFYKWQELNWLYELKEELHADETIGNA